MNVVTATFDNQPQILLTQLIGTPLFLHSSSTLCPVFSYISWLASSMITNTWLIINCIHFEIGHSEFDILKKREIKT
jgi:hypothetical protein